MEKTVAQTNGEIEKLVADKIELENQVKRLSDKLTSVEAERNKHETEAKEAIVGWEKTKAEVASFRKKLEQALNEKHGTEERSSNVYTGLKECMHQLHLDWEEQVRRRHDATRRRILGEVLYLLVNQIEHENAAKVTDMLLEMDHTVVRHLLDSPQALNAKVSEALDVLRNVNQPQGSDGNKSGSPSDLLASLSINDHL